jgi:hypothetical protein
MKVDCDEKGIEKTWQVIKKGGITIFLQIQCME